MADPEDDEKELDDEDESESEPEGAAPAAPADPKDQLYQMLQKKLSDESPSEKLASGRQAMGDQTDLNSLLAALSGSAAMAGNVGGKQSASAAPVEQQAQQLNQGAMANQQALGQEANLEDKERDQLYKYLQAKSNQEFQAKKLGQQQDIAQGKLQAQKEHNKAMEGIASKNAETKSQALTVNVGKQENKEGQKEEADDYKKLKDSQDKYDKDPIVLDARKKLDETNQADEMLDAARVNPVARNSIALSLARMVVPSRLNETEIKSLGGSKSVSDQLAQVFDDMTQGNLSDANYNYMKGFVASMRRSQERNLEDRTQYHAKQYAGRSGKEVPQAYQDLTGTPMGQTKIGAVGGAPAGQPSGTANAAPGKTLVKRQFNAKTKQYRNIYSDGSIEVENAQ